MLKKVSSNNTVQQHNQSEIGYIRKILDYKEDTDQFLVLVSFENLNEPIWIFRIFFWMNEFFSFGMSEIVPL